MAAAISRTTLAAADGAKADLFGSAVTVNGDTALVGAPFDDNDVGKAAGAAYVFVRVGDTWSEQAKLTVPDGQTAEHLGTSVALDGDTALLGTNSFADPRLRPVYVFVRDGTTWSEQARLSQPGPPDDSQFGRAVALSGDTAVIGAALATRPGVGAAFVFVRSKGVWTEQAKLFAPDPTYDMGFGQAVDVQGDTVVVGAPKDFPSARAQSGSAYVFERAADNWTLQATLGAPGQPRADLFGFSVAAAEGVVFVGAPGDDFGFRTDVGSVYQFVRADGTWPQQARLVDPARHAFSRYGDAVATDGMSTLIGAPFVSSSGLAYAYAR